MTSRCFHSRESKVVRPAWSACLDRCAEDVGIVALVVPKLEFIDVQMQILFADLVEGAHDPALHNRPETFDGVGMNRASHIFSCSVVDHAMRDALINEAVALMIIRRKQADMVGNSFMNEAIQRRGIGTFNHASHDIPFPLHGVDDNKLPCSVCATEIPASAFAFVFILGLPSDIGFIDFDIADQLPKFDIPQCHSDFVTHQPGGFVGAKAHVSADLKGTHAFLAGEHQMNDAEPFTQGLVGVLKDSADQHRESIADIPWRALIALPMEGFRMSMNIGVATPWTLHPVGPAIVHQIRPAGHIIRKHTLEVYHCHLVDVQRAFRFLHGLVSLQSGASMPC